MRRTIALCLLLASACEDAPAADGGTDTMEADASSSSGDESGEESSSGGPEEWAGEAASIRMIEAPEGDSCAEACGTSACLAAVDFAGERQDCDFDERSPIDCTCADFSAAATASSTHAVSDCWLDPNASTDGFSMSRPEQWPGGACSDYCSDEGLGECVATMWVDGDGCADIIRPDGGFRWTVDMDGSTVRPDGVPGLDGDGVFRIICEI